MNDKIEHHSTISSFKPLEETLLGLVSLIELTTIDEAQPDKDWILAMQEELG